MNTEAPHCIVCGSSTQLSHTYKFADLSPFAPNNTLNLSACLGCGFVRNTQFTREGCIDFYKTNESGYIGSSQFSPESIELRLKHEVQLDFIRELYEGGAWLDVGCCDGALQQCARRHQDLNKIACEFHSIDLNTSHLTKLGDSLSIKFHDGDIEKGNFPQELRGVELITLMHVLEHLYDPQGALKYLREVGSPNAVLVIEIPDREGYGFNGMPEFWYSLVEHVNHFDLRNLIEMASQAGWSLLRAKRYIGRSPGLDYPAVIAAFESSHAKQNVSSKISNEMMLIENNLAKLAEALSFHTGNEKVCFWGISKLLKLILPRLTGSFKLFDSKGNYKNSMYSRDIIAEAPTPDRFDTLIIGSRVSSDSILSSALSLGWRHENILNLSDLNKPFSTSL